MSIQRSEWVAGVDEAGRGPLAGPVVAAAVILDPDHPIEGLQDSKKLSHLKREKLYSIIEAHAIAWGCGSCSPEEIDSINILQASLLAMSRAIDSLQVQPSRILVDGPFVPPSIAIPAEGIVRGDSLIPAISAASILAKVTRDRLMCDYAKVYPEYGFESHKGYPTAQHIKALSLHGSTPLHRKSFKYNRHPHKA